MPSTISVITPRSPSARARTGSPTSSARVWRTGASSASSIARPAVRARASAAPSRRSRSASASRASALGASCRRRSSRRAARSSSRSASSSLRCAARSPWASTARALALLGDGGGRGLGRRALRLPRGGRPARAAPPPRRARPRPPRAGAPRPARSARPRAAAAPSRSAPARGPSRARSITLASSPSRRAISSACEGPGPPERERVGGRERLRVEADGAVERARRRARPLLDLGVVRRRDRERRALRQLVEQGARQRGALDRVGAGGDLVEQHERARRGRLEHVHEVAQVPRERRERGRDRLLVADVGEHVGEDGQAGALGRDVQAALVEQRAQPERLQRDRLAARVGAAEHEHAHAGERQVDRHDGRRVEQRVPRGDQLDVAGRLDRAAAPAARERPAGEREVDRGQHLDGVRQLVRVRCRHDARARPGCARPRRARRPRARAACSRARRSRTARRTASARSCSCRARSPAPRCARSRARRPPGGRRAR